MPLSKKAFGDHGANIGQKRLCGANLDTANYMKNNGAISLQTNQFYRDYLWQDILIEWRIYLIWIMSYFRKSEKRGQIWTVTKMCKMSVFGVSKWSLIKRPFFFRQFLFFVWFSEVHQKNGGQFWTHTLWIPLEIRN